MLNRMAILWEKGVKGGKLTLPDFVSITSANAAKIFNLYPRKGKITAGSDADIVVWGRRPSVISKDTHHSAVDFNVFEGTQTEFGPVVVIAAGRIVLDEDGKLHTIQGSGRFVSGSPFSHVAYSRHIQRDLNLGPIKVDRSAAAVAAAGATELPSDQDLVAGDSRNGSATKKPLSVNTDLDAIRAEVALVCPPFSVKREIIYTNCLNRQQESAQQRSPSGSSSGSLTPTGFHRIHTRSGVKSQQVCNIII